MSTTIFPLVLLLAGIFFFHAIRTRKAHTLQEFFLHNGVLQFGKFTNAVIAANLSLGNFIFLCAIWAYLYGFPGIAWIVIGVMIEIFVFLKFAPALKSYVNDDTNSGSIHEFVAEAFCASPTDASARRLRLVASAVTVSGLLLAIVLEAYLAAELIAVATPLSVPVIYVGIITIIAIYAAFGGFPSVIFTDMLQTVMMVFGLLALAGVALWFGPPIGSYYGEFPPIFSSHFFDLGWPSIISIIVICSGWFLVTMDTWQRNCASRSIDTSRLGIIWGGFILIVFIFMYGLIGLYVKLAVVPAQPAEVAGQLSDGLNPLADLFLLGNVSASPILLILMGIVGVGFLMAAISSVDTFLIVASHSFVSDAIVGVYRGQRFGHLDDEENRFLTRLGRLTIIWMAVGALAIGILLDYVQVFSNPLDLFFAAYSLQFALLPPVIVGLWGGTLLPSSMPRWLKQMWAALPFVTSDPFSKRVSATAILIGLVCGFLASLASGLGIAITMNFVSENVSAQLYPVLALSPAIAIASGFGGIMLGQTIRGAKHGG